jgi:hypothetical protein
MARLMQVVTLAALVTAWGDARGDEVYRNDFRRPDRLAQNWSPVRRDVTPSGGRLFLGRFGNETVTLSLTGLPNHRYLKISYDLYVMTTWAGNHKSAPSVWQLAMDGGPLLVDTSFSLWPDCEGYLQSYPANRQLGEAPGYTGAAEKNTLGFKYDEQWGVRDAVYPMSFIVGHTADTVQFHFAGVGIPGTVGQPSGPWGSWGLANVVVETLDRRPILKLDRAQLEKAWQALAETDAVKASQAVRELIGAEDQAVAFLADQVGQEPTAEAIKKRIRQLDSDRFEEREEATRRLTDLGSRARPLVKEALSSSRPSLEMRKRLEELLETSGPGGAAYRRERQVCYVLEVVGTDSAKNLLARVASAKPKP